MKDPAHHQDKTQRKILRKARQEEEAVEEKIEEEAPLPVEEEQMPVEVEEQQLFIRPSQRDSH